MSDFVQFARATGLDITSVIASGKIIRCGTTLHPRSKNGAYMFDGKFGWTQAWDVDGEVNIYGEKKEFTPADRDEWLKRKQAQEAQQVAINQRAIQKTKALIQASEMKTHDYFIYQHLNNSVGHVTTNNELVIPMFSLNAELQGAQIITFNSDLKKFEKKMIYGTKAKGAIHRLGNKNALETILCEGYATGLSIKLACDMARLNASVMVCFSANNLVEIAQKITGKCYVFADNDVSGVGETSAQKTGLAYVMSDVIGDDANDLHRKSGLIAVLKKVMEVRAKK
jgi:putative DNA primase/helicase